MSLYDEPKTGDFLPYVKYNAKAGRWYTKKDGQEVEVINPVFVADFSKVKKIWAHFAAGLAPDVVEFPSLDAVVPQPSPNHKKGIMINLYSAANFGGVVVLSATSNLTCKAFAAIYDAYLGAPESKQGMLPVVKVTGVRAETGKNGTNYEPLLVIEKWVARPAAFDEVAAQAPAAQVQAAPPPPAPVQNTGISEF